MTVFCLLTISSTLRIEAVYFSETSMDFYRATRRHISDDSILRGLEGVCEQGAEGNI
jgi:hypothetical protein